MKEEVPNPADPSPTPHAQRQAPAARHPSATSALWLPSRSVDLDERSFTAACRTIVTSRRTHTAPELFVRLQNKQRKREACIQIRCSNACRELPQDPGTDFSHIRGFGCQLRSCLRASIHGQPLVLQIHAVWGICSLRKTMRRLQCNPADCMRHEHLAGARLAIAYQMFWHL
jgi:hypothetical protein